MGTHMAALQGQPSPILSLRFDLIPSPDFLPHEVAARQMQGRRHGTVRASLLFPFSPIRHCQPFPAPLHQSGGKATTLPSSLQRFSPPTLPIANKLVCFNDPIISYPWSSLDLVSVYYVHAGMVGFRDGLGPIFSVVTNSSTELAFNPLFAMVLGWSCLRQIDPLAWFSLYRALHAQE